MYKTLIMIYLRKQIIKQCKKIRSEISNMRMVDFTLCQKFRSRPPQDLKNQSIDHVNVWRSILQLRILYMIHDACKQIIYFIHMVLTHLSFFLLIKYRGILRTGDVFWKKKIIRIVNEIILSYVRTRYILSRYNVLRTKCNTVCFQKINCVYN